MVIDWFVGGGERTILCNCTENIPQQLPNHHLNYPQTALEQQIYP